jgi:hypothetical protein
MMQKRKIAEDLYELEDKFYEYKLTGDKRSIDKAQKALHKPIGQYVIIKQDYGGSLRVYGPITEEQISDTLNRVKFKRGDCLVQQVHKI